MKPMIRVLGFLCCLAALAACAGEENGHQDVRPDTPTDDLVMDDTAPPDVPDLRPDPDATETPPDTTDLRPDPDATDTADATDAREDGACTVGLTGDACTSASSCACVPSSARECLTTLSGYITFPGGYCSARCSSPADCGTGANCATVTTGTNYCLKVCSSASQCRMAEGYTCKTIPMSSDTRTYCLPPDGSDVGPG